MRIYEQTGDTEQAVKLYREALDRLRSHHQEHSYAYARNVERLGIIAAAANRSDEAELHLREALAIYRRCLRDDSCALGWTLAYVGIVQRQQGQYEAAIETLGQANDIFRRVAAGSPLDSTSWCESQLNETRRQLAANSPAP